MLIKSTVCILDGNPDIQKEHFAIDCHFELPEDVTTLPVVLGSDVNTVIGKVVEISNEGKSLSAIVDIHDQYREVVRHSKAIVRELGLAVWGWATKEGKDAKGVVINRLQLHGLQLGINVDLDCGGFSYVDSNDDLILRASDSPYYPPVGDISTKDTLPVQDDLVVDDISYSPRGPNVHYL